MSIYYWTSELQTFNFATYLSVRSQSLSVSSTVPVSELDEFLRGWCLCWLNITVKLLEFAWMWNNEILNKLEQFIPACGVALRLKFYLRSYSLTCLWSQVKASQAEFQGQDSYLLLWTANMILLLNPSEGYDLLLKRSMISLSCWTVRYAIFIIPHTGSEFHVQLPLNYEGYYRYSVPLTGVVKNIPAFMLTGEVRQVQYPSLWGTIQHACFGSSLPQV
jgi:hypothetical protein